jgi:hypothetical protein
MSRRYVEQLSDQNAKRLLKLYWFSITLQMVHTQALLRQLLPFCILQHNLRVSLTSEV